MAAKKELTIEIQDDNDHSAEGTLFYTAYNPADRTTRAITALVVCWLLAGVTLFIPIAHFFLVPAFLIAGPVLAFSRYKQEDSKEKVEGTCPRHNGQVTIKLENTDKLPKWTYCPECDGAIQLVEKASS
ncbi:MAG: hypothetical protein R3240_12065 [Gammaproteobacteria bacterium]|nr:hypothetical protein [Gammaproteobacteria bacterium]